MMKNSKTKNIKKLSTPIHPSQLNSLASNKILLKGKHCLYQVGQTIYEKPSKKGKVCVLINTNEKKEFIGKYIVHQKQHQVIFECYFLNTLSGNSICNFIELIRAQDGYWIVIQKAKSSLLDYLPKIKPEDVRTILENIARAYVIFYRKKISHRDLKLSNLVIDNEEKKTIKFIDLELCEKNDHVYGTSEFIPPEIRLIDWSVCDSYAFGKIAQKLCDFCEYQDDKIREMIKGCTDRQLQTRWKWKQIFSQFNISQEQLNLAQPN